MEESGGLKQVDADNAGIASRGSYEYTAPDGTLIKVEWIADENGFHPSGNHLPVAPPIPDHVVKMLADLRTAGVIIEEPEVRNVPVAPVPVRKIAPAPVVQSVPVAPVPVVKTVPVLPAPVVQSVPVAPAPAAPAVPVVKSVPAPPVPVPVVQSVPVAPAPARTVQASASSKSAPGRQIQASAAAFSSGVPARNVQPPRTRVASIPSVPAIQSIPLAVPDQIVLPARTLQLPLIPLSAPMPDNVLKFLSSKASPTYFPGH